MLEREVRKHPPDWVIDTVPESAAKAFRANLLELANAVRQSGAKIILATHANRINNPMTPEDVASLTTWRKQNPKHSEHCILEMESLANDIIKEVSVQQNIPVVDIANVVPKSSQYFADYLHFTDQGASLVAQAFVTEVLRSHDGHGN